MALNYNIVRIPETGELLIELGRRLRTARLERNESMSLFAERLGISEGTLRAMERGASTVQIGAWLNALWILDQLHLMNAILQLPESVLDRIEAQHKRQRQRATRRAR